MSQVCVLVMTCWGFSRNKEKGATHTLWFDRKGFLEEQGRNWVLKESKLTMKKMIGNIYWEHGGHFTLNHYVSISVNQMKKEALLSYAYSPNFIRNGNDNTQCKTVFNFTSMKTSLTPTWQSPFIKTPIALNSVSIKTPPPMPCMLLQHSCHLDNYTAELLKGRGHVSCTPFIQVHRVRPKDTQQVMTAKYYGCRVAASSQKPLLNDREFYSLLKKCGHIISHFITSCLPLAFPKIRVSYFS